jgi:RNA polymerase sigma-70 factor, ECF subfamily
MSVHVHVEALTRNRAHMLRVASRIVGRDHAHDAVQEASLKALQAQFDGRCNVRTWLHRLTVTAALDILRRERRKRWSEFKPEAAAANVDSGYDVDAVVETRLLLRKLSAVDLTPEEAGLLRALVDGFSQDDMAIAFAMPLGTVKSKVFRLRERLRAARRRIA